MKSGRLVYRRAGSPTVWRYELLSPQTESYDFIIVGGGSAGCVLANRLSEDPKTSVLLIEAGDQEPQEIQIPSIAPYLQLSEVDWQYYTEPSSNYCLSMNNNSCFLPRGKVLGGSSSINFMIYVRGNKKDFDNWEAFGNTGWDYNSVLPYFKKSEGNTNKKLDKFYHGRKGYQKISEATWNTALQDILFKSVRELDYPIVDVNGAQQTGFMIPQGYYYKGSRYSASKAFLKPIEKRENLDILLNAYVTKINLTQDNRATGVVFEQNQKIYEVNANREVILSAGAFGSPQILMLSGIGPFETLRNLSIDPRVNLPVGKNLQDHVAAFVPFKIDKSLSLKRKRLESYGAMYQYALWSSGPLTTFGGVEGIGFDNTKYANKSIDWPDIEYHFVSGSFASDDGQYLRHTLNLKDETWDDYLKDLSFSDSISIIVKLMRPQSRGIVTLRSADPRQKVKVIPNYYNATIDIKTVVEGVKSAIKIGKTKAFQKIGSHIYNKTLPSCSVFANNLDQYLECFLRHFTLTLYHYCGTAKMGPYWDPEAVVDPQLRVYGTSGLRVVDASIFPTIPTGNTNGAVLMTAEKASDMIKEYWSNKLGESDKKPEKSSPKSPKINPEKLKTHFKDKKKSVINYLLTREKRNVDQKKEPNNAPKVNPHKLLEKLGETGDSLWKSWMSKNNSSVNSTSAKTKDNPQFQNIVTNFTKNVTSVKNVTNSSSSLQKGEATKHSENLSAKHDL